MKPSVFHRLGFAILWLCVVLVALLSLSRALELYWLAQWQQQERPLYRHYQQLSRSLHQQATVDENVIADWWQAESSTLAAEQRLARLPVYRVNNKRAELAQDLHRSLRSSMQQASAAVNLQKRLMEAAAALEQDWQTALDTALKSAPEETQRPEVMATLYAQAQAFDDLSRLPLAHWMNPQQGPERLSELKRRLELSQTSFDALLVGNARLQIDAVQSDKLRQALAQVREPMQQVASRLHSATAAGSPLNEYWSLQRQIEQQLRELTTERIRAVPVMPTWAAIRDVLMPLAALFALLSLVLAYVLAAQRQSRHILLQEHEAQQRHWQQELARCEQGQQKLQQAMQSMQASLQQLRSNLKPLLWPAWPDPDPLPSLQGLCRQIELPVDAAQLAADNSGEGDDSQSFGNDAEAVMQRLQTLQLNLNIEAARQRGLTDLVAYSDELLMQWREIVSKWQQQASATAGEIERLRADLQAETGRRQQLESMSTAATQALDRLQQWQRISDKRRERNLLVQQLAQQLDQCNAMIESSLPQEGES